MLVGAGVGAVSSMAMGKSPFKGALTGAALGGAGSAISGGMTAAGGLGEAVGAVGVDAAGGAASDLLSAQLTQATVPSSLMSPEAFSALPLEATGNVLPSMFNPVGQGGMGMNFATYDNPMSTGFDMFNSPLNDYAKQGYDYFDDKTEGMGIGNIVADQAVDTLTQPEDIIVPKVTTQTKQAQMIPQSEGLLNVLGPTEADTLGGNTNPSLLNNAMYANMDEIKLRQLIG